MNIYTCLRLALCFSAFAIGVKLYAGEADVNALVVQSQNYLDAAPAARSNLTAKLAAVTDINVIDSVMAALERSQPKAWTNAAGELHDQPFCHPALAGKYEEKIFYFVPDEYDAVRPSGLMIYMHGGGDGHTPLAPYINAKTNGYNPRVHLDGLDLILAVPTAPLEKSTARWCVPRADEYLADVIKECRYRFNIDRDRVILAGHSMGGFGAYHLCQRLNDRISAGFAIAGHWSCSDFICMRNVSFAIFHGENDAVAPDTPGQRHRPRFTDIAFARSAAEFMQAAGADVLFVEHPGGHDYTGAESEFRRCMEWLAGKRRNPYPRELVALTPRGWSVNPRTPPTPRSWWVDVLETGAGAIEYEKITRTGPILSRQETREEFEAQGFELIKAAVPHAGRVTALNRGGNVFELKTENVETLTLWLHPDMADFDRPVTVKVNDREIKFDIQPSLLSALNSYERSGDFGLVYYARLEIQVHLGSVILGIFPATLRS